MIECCEFIGAEEVDCTSMNMMGGSMGAVSPGCLKNVTFLYPNMYLYNRKGECSTEIWFRDPHNRTGSITANIKFDTYVRPGNVPLSMGEYDGLEELYKSCNSPDLDPLDSCHPVDCHKKYNGHRNYFDQVKKLCVCNPECYSCPHKELPDVAYLPTCNQCRDLEQPISERDTSYLLRQSSSDLPKGLRCGSHHIGIKILKECVGQEYSNVRCHHGRFNKNFSMCDCDPGWTSAQIPEDLYLPSTLLLHFCTVRSPPLPVLDIARALMVDVSRRQVVSFFFFDSIVIVAGIASVLLLLAILLLTVKSEDNYRSLYEIRRSRSNSCKNTPSRSLSPTTHSDSSYNEKNTRFHRSSYEHDKVGSRTSRDTHNRQNSPSTKSERHGSSNYDDHEHRSRTSTHYSDKHGSVTNRDIINKENSIRETMKHDPARNKKNIRSSSLRHRSSKNWSINSIRQSRDKRNSAIINVLTEDNNAFQQRYYAYPLSSQFSAYFLKSLSNTESHGTNNLLGREKYFKCLNASKLNRKADATCNTYKMKELPIARKACVKKRITFINRKTYWESCIRVIHQRSSDGVAANKKRNNTLENVMEILKEIKIGQNENIICNSTSIVAKIKLLETYFDGLCENFNKNNQTTTNNGLISSNDLNIYFEVVNDYKKYYSEDISLGENKSYAIDTLLNTNKYSLSDNELILENISTNKKDATQSLSNQMQSPENQNINHQGQLDNHLENKFTEISMRPTNQTFGISEGNGLSISSGPPITLQSKCNDCDQNTSLKCLLNNDENNVKTNNKSKSTRSFIPVMKSIHKNGKESKVGNLEQSLISNEKNSSSIKMTAISGSAGKNGVHTPETKQNIRKVTKKGNNTRVNEARKIAASNLGKFMKYGPAKDNRIIVDDIMNAFSKKPNYYNWIKLFQVNDIETDLRKLTNQYNTLRAFEKAILAANHFQFGCQINRKKRKCKKRKPEDCLIVFGRSLGELKRYRLLVRNYTGQMDALGPLLAEPGPPFDPSAFPIRGVLRLHTPHSTIQGTRRLLASLLHHPSAHFRHALFLYGSPSALDRLQAYCGSVARIKYHRELKVHTLDPSSNLYDFLIKNLLNPPLHIKKSSVTPHIPHLHILWRSTLIFQRKQINSHTFTRTMNFISTLIHTKIIKNAKQASTDLNNIKNIYNDFLSVQLQKDKLKVPFKIIEILLKNIQTMKRREMIVNLVNQQIDNINHSLSLTKKQAKINNVVNQMKRDLDNAVTRYYEALGEFDYC